MDALSPLAHDQLLDAYEVLVRNLIHDLRQPLGNIDSCACFLKLVLGPEHARADRHLQILEDETCEAARLLSETAAALAHLRHQRAGTASATLPVRTNSASAGVT